MKTPIEGLASFWPPTLEFLTNGPTGSELRGRSSRYERVISDLDGLYLDDRGFQALVAENPDRLVYWVDENQAGEQPGALIVGMSALAPGDVGGEFFMTRGHLHARPNCAEFYYCVSGSGLLLMDNLEGNTSIAHLKPNQGVHVPGGWIHRSVNVGETTFTTVFAYDRDAGQNYELIERAGGMRKRIMRRGDSWEAIPNQAHTSYDPSGWAQ
jgi:glucose-6-phosphate isomerase